MYRTLRYVALIGLIAAMVIAVFGMATGLAASPPTIEREWVSQVSANDATLNARFETKGLATTYRLYLVATPRCVEVKTQCEKRPDRRPRPLLSRKVPASPSRRTVSSDVKAISGPLGASRFYKYWVVVTNAAGTTIGKSKLFRTKNS